MDYFEEMIVTFDWVKEFQIRLFMLIYDVRFVY